MPPDSQLIGEDVVASSGNVLLGAAWPNGVIALFNPEESVVGLQ